MPVMLAVEKHSPCSSCCFALVSCEQVYILLQRRLPRRNCVCSEQARATHGQSTVAVRCENCLCSSYISTLLGTITAPRPYACEKGLKLYHAERIGSETSAKFYETRYPCRRQSLFYLKYARFSKR